MTLRRRIYEEQFQIEAALFMRDTTGKQVIRRNVMMRFYEGYVLGYINAVCPLDDNVSYRVVDVRDARGRRGIIRFGYEREDTIGLGSIIVIVRKIGNTWKRRIYKMKFSREEGKYIFDLPDFLRSKGIKYKLYKRYTLSGGYCMGGGYNTIICARGDIVMGLDYYSEYSESVYFREKRHSIKINDKKVSLIYRSRLTSYDHKIIDWYKSLLEKGDELNLSYEELGQMLDELGIEKTDSDLEIHFSDGESVTGDKIWGK